MVAVFGMEWYFSPYVVPTFLAGIAAAILAWYAWRHRTRRTALSFIGLMVGLCIWAIGYGIQLGFAARGPMLAMDKVAFVGSVVAPTAWLMLAIEYAGYERWLTRRVLSLLAVEPLVTLALVWTNERHGLIWRAVSVDASGPFSVLDLTFGPAYWLNFGYSYLLLAVGILLLAGVVGRANRIHRWQSLFLVVGAVVPLGANASFNLFPTLNPIPNLDLTTFAFAVTGALYALALFRFRMLDLVPAARERLIEQMNDGVVVLSHDGTIVDLNPTASAALGPDALGSHVSETPLGDATGVVEGPISLDLDEESRSFDVSATSISDFRGEEAGRFVLMRDFTQLEVLHAQEQRLSVLNRLLRHNVRNEVNVISGRFELLTDDLEDPSNPNVTAIHRAIDRITSMSRQARHVETSIARTGSSDARVDLTTICRRTVAETSSAFPDADVEVTGPEAAWVRGLDREQLANVVDALVENAVVHNPDPAPQVVVDVEVTDGQVRLAVADDGPGIPEIERAILDRERETALEHGTGLGLWLVKWSVEGAGGEVRFEESELGGTRVVVELPGGGPADGET